jgi:hypothetical protein
MINPDVSYKPSSLISATFCADRGVIRTYNFSGWLQRGKEKTKKKDGVSRPPGVWPQSHTINAHLVTPVVYEILGSIAFPSLSSPLAISYTERTFAMLNANEVRAKCSPVSTYMLSQRSTLACVFHSHGVRANTYLGIHVGRIQTPPFVSPSPACPP